MDDMKDGYGFPQELSKVNICRYCHKEYVRIKGKTGSFYCSDKCRYNAQKERYIAKQKQKRTAKYNPYVQKTVTDLIQKIQQAGEIYDGFFIDYWGIGDISNTTRQRVLMRDDNRCHICSCPNNLHLHHMIPRKYGGNHDESNLITLCASCHRHIETGDIEHAIRACQKNYDKYFLQKEDDIKDSRDVVLNAIYILNNINKELVCKLPDDAELLTRIDKVISNLEELNY